MQMTFEPDKGFALCGTIRGVHGLSFRKLEVKASISGRARRGGGLCSPVMLGLAEENAILALKEEVKSLKKRIDDTELFYRVEFPAHLQSQADYACCCFECGFHDPEGVECICCPKEQAGLHKNSCSKCSDMFSIIDHLKAKHIVASARPNISLRQQEDLDQLWEDIAETKTDLDHYRSHLARQVYESRRDEEEIRNLPDDTVRITTDWKHKIQEVYFRENMMKYFGKKGTSMLGFMMMWNSADPEERARGIKEVRFVMMLTDDSLQDEWSVVCAKQEIYTNHLPKHIKKSIFVADGASCFASKLHRALQPLWQSWVGIVEVGLRITVAGDGKSILDGMFGRLMAVLSTAANSGMSYRDASEILRAIEYSGAGLTATSALTYVPDRTYRVYCELSGSVDLEGVLRTVLNNDGSITAYRHSGIGGFSISPFVFGLYKSKDTKRTVKRKKAERLDADRRKVCYSLTRSICNFIEVESDGEVFDCLQLVVARRFRAWKLWGNCALQRTNR